MFIDRNITGNSKDNRWRVSAPENPGDCFDHAPIHLSSCGSGRKREVQAVDLARLKQRGIAGQCGFGLAGSGFRFEQGDRAAPEVRKFEHLALKIARRITRNSLKRQRLRPDEIAGSRGIETNFVQYLGCFISSELNPSRVIDFGGIGKEPSIGTQPVCEHYKPAKGMLEFADFRKRFDTFAESVGKPTARELGEFRDSGEWIQTARGPPVPRSIALAYFERPSVMAYRSDEQAQGRFSHAPGLQHFNQHALDEPLLFEFIVISEEAQNSADMPGHKWWFNERFILKAEVEFSYVMDSGENR